jgi:Ni,Fe-hydrogenase III large subunit
VSDEPGSCPKCGMDLVPRESAGGMDHGHMDHSGYGGHDNTDHEAMDHGDSGGHGAATMGHEAHGRAGMQHGLHEEHGGHGDHSHMDHGDMGFMSMIEMTKDLPRSSDGLQMEWVEAPFGPLFPGLPGGLYLKLTLDGDTVAGAEADGVGGGVIEDLAGPAETFADRLSELDPLSPVAYHLLAIRAVEEAAGIPVDEETALARAGALERERAASHLNWLAGLAHLLGYAWLEGRAARLQLALLRAADAQEAARLRGEVLTLAYRVRRTPLLKRKLRGIGRLPGDAEALGPVVRAGGGRTDARAEDEVYRALLGFGPAVREGNDALSRLLVRLEEAEQSLDLVRQAGHVSIPTLALDGDPSGSGAATVETPRGAATLRVTLQGGAVRDLKLDTPSAKHMDSIEAVTAGEELANALVGIASLDISPWEVVR